jgi:hypothetical protein
MLDLKLHPFQILDEQTGVVQGSFSTLEGAVRTVGAGREGTRSPGPRIQRYRYVVKNVHTHEEWTHQECVELVGKLTAQPWRPLM